MSHRKGQHKPDIMLTKEDDFMKVVDAPPEAIKAIQMCFPNHPDRVSFNLESTIGLILTKWMKDGYTIGFDGGRHEP